MCVYVCICVMYKNHTEFLNIFEHIYEKKIKLNISKSEKQKLNYAKCVAN